jgi:hypothetical protein
MTTTETTTLPAIFAECCAKESTRYSFGRPWGMDGKVYAIDGRILVMCDGVAEPLENAPPAKNVFRPLHEYGAPVPLPQWEAQYEPCDECDGSGGSKEQCKECDGHGVYECPTCERDGYTCHGCWGKKYVDSPAGTVCAECTGTGKVIKQIAIQVGSSYINSRYAAILKRHGVTHVRINLAKPKDAAIYFEGQGFVGLVMPMRNRGDE